MRTVIFVGRFVALMLAIVLAGILWSKLAGASCWASDVRAVCCPAARAARWPQRDEVLRGCMRGLGCTLTAGATASGVCGVTR